MRLGRSLLLRYWRLLLVMGALTLYLLLTSYQLHLPGLHYDEAAEAGVNAMELLTSAPVSAFRGVTWSPFGRPLPLMVQDYIGALNVYLALPFLALTGIGVPNLRFVSLLTGLAALLLLERAVSEFWILDFRFWKEEVATPVPKSKIQNPKSNPPISTAGLLATLLLAASPSFVFWSRQGIFVTNLTEPLCCWSIWQGVRWLRTGRPAALLLSAFAGGLAIYAKLLAIWVIGPFGLLAGGWWLWQRQRQSGAMPRLSLLLLVGMVAAFLIPLTPLLFFNWQTGGTLARITGSLDQSYYGVENSALVQNALVRGRQLVQTLRGDHFWYLGGSYSNELAPWLAVLLVSLGLVRQWRMVVPPLALLALAFLGSLFTVSDLFITHYALLQPLFIAPVAIGAALWLEPPVDAVGGLGWSRFRAWAALALAGLLLWLALDLVATVRYHRALAQSGGLVDHSDASYHLAYHLRYNGLGAPIALDWGFAAPVRYLSEGAVQPIEIFGYASPAAPDADFVERLRPFLENPDNVYLLHAPGATVFAGRREGFEQAGQALGRSLVLEQTFAQRDGTPLYELWRVVP
jgi:hypothetical protein